MHSAPVERSLEVVTVCKIVLSTALQLIQFLHQFASLRKLGFGASGHGAFFAVATLPPLLKTLSNLSRNSRT